MRIIRYIFLSFVLALLLTAVCYPEFWINPKVSYFDTDHRIDFIGSFVITSFFYQGGVQLWDNHDQMPYAYLCLTNGIYKFPNLITALTYILLSPFSEFPAKFFYQVFSVTHLISLLFLRIVGSYLFLRIFCREKFLLICTTIYLSVILSPQFFLIGVTDQSLYPLMLYLVLRFFETWKLKDFLLAGVYFAICLSYGVLNAGYMYQGIHFLIAALVVKTVLERRDQLKDFWHRKKSWCGALLKTFRSFPWLLSLATLATIIIILIPDLVMVKNNLPDYSFGYEDSRIKKMWDIETYFKKPNIAYAQSGEILWRALDFTNSHSYGASWFFIGFSTIVFALVGVVLGRDRRKYVFVFAIVMIWALNNPKNTLPFGMAAHFLNALTNPLSSFTRTFHFVSVMVLQYLLAPLCIMGVQAVWQKVKLNNTEEWPVGKLKILAVVIMIVIWAGMIPLSLPGRVYLFISLVIFIALMLVAVVINSAKLIKPIAAVLISSLFFIDAVLMVNYVKSEVRLNFVHSHNVVGRPELGKVGVDFQNPKILPFRFYYDIANYPVENHYFINSHINMPGIYFRFNNMFRNFMWINNYTQRHKSYASWLNDPDMMAYVQSNRRHIFFAPHGVEASDTHFRKIILGGLMSDVVMIDGENNSTPLNKIIPNISPSLPDQISWKNAEFKLDEKHTRQLNGLKGYGVKLPKDFPSYLASTYLTLDSGLIRLFLEAAPGQLTELSPVQGEIVRPGTFDVQNIRDGWLTIGMPNNFQGDGKRILLTYEISPVKGITKIWRNQSDNLGLDFTADQDGWLVFHYPYDPKWKVWVDGKPTEIARANKSFMAVELKEGKHIILLKYWPETPLRGMILVSLIFAFFDLLVIFYFIFKREKAGSLKE